ncbi:hypothetical protein CFP56_039158 [Quercus suber]|uniref:Uncharacterized protein n=1 Tax=Quercus suber TaxID=58331 RepID=A0AAW0J0N3_QUESU
MASPGDMMKKDIDKIIYSRGEWFVGEVLACNLHSAAPERQLFLMLRTSSSCMEIEPWDSQHFATRAKRLVLVGGLKDVRLRWT